MSTPKITKSGFVGNLTGTASAAIWEGVAGRPGEMSTAEVQTILNKGSYTGSNYLGGTGLGALRNWIEARETGSLSGSFIPYDVWNEDENAYTLQNKNIEVKDDYDNHSSTLVSGPGIRAAKLDGTQIAVAGYDNVAVGVGNGDINGGGATLMNIIALTPSIGGDDDESGVINKFITDASEFRGKLQPVSLEFLSSIPSEGRRGKIELGFTGDNGNLVRENELYFKLTHPDSGKVSLYALRNAELDNADAPKYLALEEEWNIAIFDTTEFNKGAITLTAPEGYIFDKMYVLCHWYGSAGVATTVYGGFYNGANTDASKQVLRNNGTNKMGAGWFTANVVNLNDTTAIAYGDCYLYNNNGSAASLNNPVNTYGIGRFSHSNDFTHFSIHGYPSNITEGYCYIKYLLKKQ